MGYAEAAGLPAISGLYATVIPLVIYALIGPSRSLVLGPDSSLAPMIAAVVVPVSARTGVSPLEVAGLLSLIVGAMMIAAGVARLGFLTELLSSPVRYGYLNGIALIVIVSQVPKVLGVSVESVDLPGRVVDMASAIGDGQVQRAPLIIGCASLVAMLGLRRWHRSIPAELIVMLASMAAVGWWEVGGSRLSTVGTMPRGLPSVSVPEVPFAEIGPIVAAAVWITIVALADTSVLSRSIAAKRHESVDANYEIAVLGLTNVANAFGSGFPISSSQSRTSVAAALGGRTQLAPLAGAGAVMLFLVAWPGAFRTLPTATLAAVVICAALRMVQVRAVVALARVRNSEVVLSVVSFIAVAALGVLWGIAVAIGLSVLNVVRKAWRPHTAELVRVDGLKGYHDASRHPEGQRIPGLVLFRFDAPLFFANAAGFRTALLSLLRNDTTRVVVTAEPMTDIDATAVEMLTDLHRELADRHVVLAFAEMKGHLRERMARAGLVDVVGPGRFAPTVGEAVRSHLVEHDIEWVDWEDRSTPARDDQR